MPRTKIVYEGGRLENMTSQALLDYMIALDAHNSASEDKWEISDRAAQTIAAMWHSPSNPNSTMLSTRGMVTETTCLGDFCTEYEYLAVDSYQRACLDALKSYIESKQEQR